MPPTKLQRTTPQATTRAATRAALARRVALLERVCGEAYQVAGAVGAPVRVLDQLRAASEGEPLPHATILPVTAEECDEVAAGQAVLRQVRAVVAPHIAPAAGRARRRPPERRRS